MFLFVDCVFGFVFVCEMGVDGVVFVEVICVIDVECVVCFVII